MLKCAWEIERDTHSGRPHEAIQKYLLQKELHTHTHTHTHTFTLTHTHTHPNTLSRRVTHSHNNTHIQTHSRVDIVSFSLSVFYLFLWVSQIIKLWLGLSERSFAFKSNLEKTQPLLREKVTPKLLFLKWQLLLKLFLWRRLIKLSCKL